MIRKKLAYLIVFFMPFTNALAISGLLNISFALASWLYILNKSKTNSKKNIFVPYNVDRIILCFALLLFVDFVLFSSGQKCFNHLLMWIVPPLIYYNSLRKTLFDYFTLKELESKLFAVITIAVTISSIFGICEFVSNNFLSINLNNFLPHGSQEASSEAYSIIGFFRSRSFMVESGHFVLFLECYTPLSIYWLYNNIRNSCARISLIVLQLVSFILTFSAAGYVLLIIGLCMFLSFSMKSKNKSKIMLIFILFVLVLFVFFSDFFNIFIDIIKYKVNGESVSQNDRQSRFEALKYFTSINSIIGYGPGSSYTLNIPSYISLYLKILMDMGIIGVIISLVFLRRQYKLIKLIKERQLRIAFLITLVLVVLHFSIVDVIYYPWFWILLSLIWSVVKLQKYESIFSNE